MTPHYSDPWLTVYHGDCRAVMAEMEPESVHCVVTSPPYWGLRDYGTATWTGGDEACDHTPPYGSSSSRLEGGKATQESAKLYRERCPKCGATRQDSQLGLEPTPEEYVANLVAVFREVRRVLRADGTVWLNLGDSYVSNGWWPDAPSSQNESISRGQKRREMGGKGITRVAGLKPKDLVGIPWRVAFALQADGWYLRSDIIWSKPNPMPESVTDRPTKSHEYLFLLSKRPTYYFDADAVREPLSESTERIHGSPNVRAQGNGSWKAEGNTDRNDGNSPTYTNKNGPAALAKMQAAGGRNIRSVWTMATQPYPGAHFATFPESLPERCIKAGTSEKGVCPECGNPWQRISERQNESTYARIQRETGTTYKDMKAEAAANGITPGNVGGTHAPGKRGAFYESPNNVTTGWRPSCAHVAEPVPATVLDPFAGSGTTGMVAQSLSRRAVLIDLSLDYLDQLMARNVDIPLGLGA